MAVPLYSLCCSQAPMREVCRKYLTKWSLLLANSQDLRWAGFEIKLVVFSGEYPIFPPVTKARKASYIKQVKLIKKSSSTWCLGLFLKRKESTNVNSGYDCDWCSHHLHELLHKNNKNDTGFITKGLYNNGKEKCWFSHCLSWELRMRKDNVTDIHVSYYYITHSLLWKCLLFHVQCSVSCTVYAAA